MEEIKIQLLNHELDALDRLFDRETSVIDAYAITFATAHALRTDPLFTLLNEAAMALDKIVRAGLSNLAAHEAALDVTNELRIRIAELVPSLTY